MLKHFTHGSCLAKQTKRNASLTANAVLCCSGQEIKISNPDMPITVQYTDAEAQVVVMLRCYNFSGAGALIVRSDSFLAAERASKSLQRASGFEPCRRHSAGSYLSSDRLQP